MRATTTRDSDEGNPSTRPGRDVGRSVGVALEAPTDLSVHLAGANEPDPTERSDGCNVSRLAARDDGLDFGLLEGPTGDRPCGFGRVPLPPSRRDDAVADLDRARFVGWPQKPDVSDDAVHFAVDHHPDAEALVARRCGYLRRKNLEKIGLWPFLRQLGAEDPSGSHAILRQGSGGRGWERAELHPIGRQPLTNHSTECSEARRST